MILPSIWNPHSTNPLCAASQRIAAVTRPAPRRRSASPRPAQCLALLVRDGGPALSGDGITRADAALPAAQDAAPGAALGAPEQDEPPGTALARVADLDLALGATQTLGRIGAVRVEEVLLLAAGGAAAVGRGAGGSLQMAWAAMGRTARMRGRYLIVMTSVCGLNGSLKTSFE